MKLDFKNKKDIYITKCNVIFLYFIMAFLRLLTIPFYKSLVFSSILSNVSIYVWHLHVHNTQSIWAWIFYIVDFIDNSYRWTTAEFITRRDGNIRVIICSFIGQELCFWSLFFIRIFYCYYHLQRVIKVWCHNVCHAERKYGVWHICRIVDVFFCWWLIPIWKHDYHIHWQCVIKARRSHNYGSVDDPDNMKKSDNKERFMAQNKI